jgi:hypothetical protein
MFVLELRTVTSGQRWTASMVLVLVLSDRAANWSNLGPKRGLVPFGIG